MSASNFQKLKPQKNKLQTDLEHWHILGAGAIGSLFACWFNERATLLLNPNSEYASSNTITLNLEKNNTSSSFTLACSTTSKAKNIQNLLVCTKANQTQKALEGLALNEHTNIVLLQNGMGNAELLKQRFPNTRIFLGTTTNGAYRPSPLHIVHAGEGQTYLGALEKNTSAEQTLKICQSLSTKQQNIQSDKDIEKRLWIKLAMNCAINPLTMIYQCRNGELLDDNIRLAHLKNICLELDQVLHLKHYLDKSESCIEIVKQVAQDTAKNYSSMYQDGKYNRPSEIDFIQGYLLKEAQHLKLTLPENQAVFNTIKKIEASY